MILDQAIVFLGLQRKGTSEVIYSQSKMYIRAAHANMENFQAGIGLYQASALTLIFMVATEETSEGNHRNS